MKVKVKGMVVTPAGTDREITVDSYSVPKEMKIAAELFDIKEFTVRILTEDADG